MSAQHARNDERSRRFTRRFVIGFAIVEAMLVGFAVFSSYYNGSPQ